MTSHNGVAPDAPVAFAGGVFAREARPLPLGAQSYVVPLLTIRELKRLKDRITTGMAIAPGGETVGEHLMAGSLMGGDFTALAEFLSIGLRQELTADALEDAEPAQIVAVVNAIMADNGLLWLEEILKNVVRRQGALLELAAENLTLSPAPESAPGGTEASPTSTTT